MSQVGNWFLRHSQDYSVCSKSDLIVLTIAWNRGSFPQCRHMGFMSSLFAVMQWSLIVSLFVTLRLRDVEDKDVFMLALAWQNVHKFVMKENSLGTWIQASLWKQNVSHREINLIKARCQCSVWDVSKIKKVSHYLIEIGCIGGVTEVSVLLWYKLVGLVSKLSFNNVLEAELVERISVIEINILLAEINLLISQSISKPKEQNRLELVPLQETETDDEWLAVVRVHIDIVFPVSVPGILNVNVITKLCQSLLFILNLEISLRKKDFW